ncbi:MAG: DUF192 domain-containing protein [Nitrospinota bacterium]
MVALNRTNRARLAEEVEVASRFWQRLRGLLGRGGLPGGGALWIVPCRSIHTWFMRFPIDVAFLDEGLRVRRTAARVPPFRVVRTPGARSVLELPAGRLEATGTREGHLLAFVPPA